MQIFISKPAGAGMGGLEDRLKKQWLLSVDYARSYDLPVEISFLEPEKYETHGDFLTRLWVTGLRDIQDIVLVSELDFVPYRQTVARVLTSQNQGALKLIGAHYVTRRPDGKLQAWQDPTGHTLLAAWFLSLRLTEEDKRILPEYWLSAGGPKNDAANLAYATGKEFGVFDDKNGAFLPFRDGRPCGHWVRYSKVGRHLFWSRDYDSPRDKPLMFFENRPPLTVDEHLADIKRLLK